MNDMAAGKTKSPRKRKRPEKSELATSDTISSKTIEIPVKALFDDTTLRHSAGIEVTCPGRRPFKVLVGIEKIVIGRGKDCGICLPLPNVSRTHAHIITNGEDVVVEDLDSTNGTFVNNVRIASCVLHDNDQIRVGEACMVFLRQKTRV